MVARRCGRRNAVVRVHGAGAPPPHRRKERRVEVAGGRGPDPRRDDAAPGVGEAPALEEAGQHVEGLGGLVQGHHVARAQHQEQRQGPRRAGVARWGAAHQPHVGRSRREFSGLPAVGGRRGGVSREGGSRFAAKKKMGCLAEGKQKLGTTKQMRNVTSTGDPPPPLSFVVVALYQPGTRTGRRGRPRPRRGCRSCRTAH